MRWQLTVIADNGKDVLFAGNSPGPDENRRVRQRGEAAAANGQGASPQPARGYHRMAGDGR
jgi:hypothetical protein